MESCTQILQKFASVAEHPEQCYDFDIQGNLDRFIKTNRNRSNLSEAAFLIYDAARIYGRKVDYLEQILLDFNQRSAAVIAQAIADKEKEDKEENAKDKKNAEKREREKERALKRAKRMVKVTTKIEFKPKPITIGTPLQISLNIHEQRSELECEEEFDQLRMKNVFPRINVIQNNLQKNNTFYDNLGIIETDCDNPDALRDFRIFMDTIDEPIYMRPKNANEPDDGSAEQCLRSQERVKQKYANIYLPADYIKETYGIILKDNSDYLNMLKYNEEVERLNLRNLTIEQLTKLKVGTYLNNILHGYKNDGKIPEHDSGIDDMDHDITIDKNQSQDSTNLFDDTEDILMTDLSGQNTSLEDNSTNVTANQSMETTDTIDQTAQSLNTTDSTLNTEAETTGDASKLNESAEIGSSSRQSLDDGIGGSLCNTPTRLDTFEGFDTADLHNGIDLPNDEQTPTAKEQEVPLVANIFQLPEKLLRRNKLFQLTDEFELWLAARKRKHGLKPDPPNVGKLLKLSSGVIVRSDPDSDDEEFLGFDENNFCRTAPSIIVIEGANPAAVTQRTCSSDSGISPEKITNINEDGNLSQTAINETQVNDSGIVDTSDSTLNTTNENTDQSIQETDLSNINANSTKIINESASIITGFDSGFAELESTIESQHDILADMGINDIDDGIEEPEVQRCTLSPIPNELEQAAAAAAGK